MAKIVGFALAVQPSQPGNAHQPVEAPVPLTHNAAAIGSGTAD